MKMKIKILALVFVFCLFLSSCSALAGYSEPEDSLVAAAIGFDADGERIKVSVQVSEGAGGKESRILSGEGASIEGAMISLSAGETKRIEYSHAAAVVIGRGIDPVWFGKIMRFCDENEEFSVSARLVSASDAGGLLSPDGFSGYELLSMITSGVGSHLSAESRLYQVFRSEDGVFALPHFASNGEGFELYGAKIYRGGEGKAILGRAEAVYYMMMRGLFGENTGGESASLIEDCKTSYKIEKNDEGKSVLRVVCEIRVKESDDGLLASVEQKMEELYTELSFRHGDLFGFAERVDGDGFEVKFECKERGDGDGRK